MNSFYKVLLIVLILIISYSNTPAQIRIGLALPLMQNSTNESEKTEAEFFLKGVQDAYEEYKQSQPKHKVEVKIGDTERDPEKAFELIRNYAADDKVIAVFGPVFSNELKSVSQIAHDSKLPVISPTATQNFIASEKEYLFQLNPTYDVRGRLMAKYAITELGMKNFVVFSEDKYGRGFASSFIQEAAELNGNIIDTVFYSDTEVNLLDKFAAVKQRILDKEKFIDFGNLNANQREILKNVHYKYSNFDSLVSKKVVISIHKLFGKNAEKTVDSLAILTLSYNEKFKEPVLGLVDAFYMPISSYTSINKVSSQYHSNKLNFPILGTSDWNNEKILINNNIYIPSLYYESDFYISDPGMQEELNKMQLDNNELKNYIFAYDGMKLILSLIGQGNISRNTLYKALGDLKDHYSFHTNVTIKNRTNQQLSIIYFNKGKIALLGRYTY